MKKKIVVYVLLLSFAHYLAACAIYKTESKLPMEAESTSKITKAVLANGEVVEFNEAGGTSRSISNTIVGTVKGKVVIADPVGLKEYRTEINRTRSADELLNKRIIEVIDLKNRLFVFDENGGTFNLDTKKITGLTPEGKEISTAASDLSVISIEKPRTVTLDELKKDNSIKIIQVISKNNLVTTFDEEGGFYKTSGIVVSGITNSGSFVSLDSEEILYIEVKKIDGVLSFFGSIGVVAIGLAAIMLIALALKESCPFIYSYDGSQYVFDAEPLGGATSEIYHRSELSLLSHLKADDGKYKLLITNEVNETQFVDALSLQYIDHDPSQKVYPDYNGQYYFVNEPAGILSAYDEDGKDLSLFLKNDDGNFWMTKMNGEQEKVKDKVRNEITITLPKPVNADKVNLIINSGTTIWGSNMIREMLNMYGNSVEEYYNKINQGGFEFKQTEKFLQDEELFQLKLYAKTGDKWIQKGIINGGGPLISETRVLQLDVTDIPGDSLVLRFNPPVGFWTFDYFAADYSMKKADNFHSLNLSSTYTAEGKDLMEVLGKDDKNYHSMPDKGMKFFAEFDAPPLEDGLTRTIFSNTSGYYKIHLDNDGPMQADLLYQMVFFPGKIVKMSSAMYFEWLKTLEKERAEVTN